MRDLNKAPRVGLIVSDDPRLLADVSLEDFNLDSSFPIDDYEVLMRRKDVVSCMRIYRVADSYKHVITVDDKSPVQVGWLVATHNTVAKRHPNWHDLIRERKAQLQLELAEEVEALNERKENV